MDAIVVDGLEKRYGDVEALDGVSFSVHEGEVFGLLGPNGAGKSTTVRVLATLTRPDAGRAEVAGHDVRRSPGSVRRSIGYVPQESGIDTYGTGRENLTLQGRVQGLGGAHAPPPGRRAARARRPGGRGRPRRQRLLGRDEAAPRRRARARPLARRCSSSTSRRPASTRRRGSRSGRRSASWPSWCADDPPDDALPRGGGRARRPARDRQPGQGRGRGHAGGAQGGRFAATP